MLEILVSTFIPIMASGLGYYIARSNQQTDAKFKEHQTQLEIINRKIEDLQTDKIGHRECASIRHMLLQKVIADITAAVSTKSEKDK